MKKLQGIHMVSSKLPLEPVEYLLRDNDKAVKLSTSGTTGKNQLVE